MAITPPARPLPVTVYVESDALALVAVDGRFVLVTENGRGRATDRGPEPHLDRSPPPPPSSAHRRSTTTITDHPPQPIPAQISTDKMRHRPDSCHRPRLITYPDLPLSVRHDVARFE
jgi:hypothetical protein